MAKYKHSSFFHSFLLSMLFFTFSPAEAQQLSGVSVYCGQYSDEFPQHIWCSVSNGSNVDLDMFSISELQVRYNLDWLQFPQGWWPLISEDEIIFVNYDPDYRIRPGEWLGNFMFWGPTPNFVETKYLVCGNCNVDDESGGLAWGTTIGHASY